MGHGALLATIDFTELGFAVRTGSSTPLPDGCVNAASFFAAFIEARKNDCFGNAEARIVGRAYLREAVNDDHTA